MQFRKVVFMVTCLLGNIAGVSAQVQVSVAPYYGGRLAALSLTFDDGLEDQYTLAAPQLNSRGLKATFAIVGSKVGGKMRSKQDRAEGTDGTPVMTWDMVRQLAADGHEISSHGWEHRAVTRLSEEELHREVACNDSAIFRETGQWPTTFFYPGNNKNDSTVAFCEQGRVGTRTFQISVGSKRSQAFLRAYVDSLIARGEWGVTMTHGIARGYDHFNDPQVLWSLLDYLVEKREQLWVAPFRDVAAYVKEAASTRCEVRCVKNGLVIRPHMDLDHELFRHPLTIVLTGCEAEAFTAEQDGLPLNVVRKDGCLLVDIAPGGGDVVITHLAPRTS